jgi:signal transduction histidine kinase
MGALSAVLDTRCRQPMASSPAETDRLHHPAHLIAEHLAAEQLRRDEKLESIGRFAGGIAHDFNNLLTVINGYSDLALASVGGDEERLRAAIEQVRRAGERAAGLTQHLLAFSRRQVLKPQVLDLNRIVAEYAPLLTRILGEAVVVKLSLGAEVAAVRADPGQVGQIVLALALNGRDAMPSGGTIGIKTQTVTIRERTPVDVEPGEYTVLSVTDSGEGMEPEVLRRIFDPFFTTKPPGEGTGLGLAAVHGIVEQSGGRTTVYSEPGLGTTFRIYLPAQQEREEPRSSEPAAGGERVLLVEDNEAVRGLVRDMLLDRGYDVLVAAGPGQALALADGLPELDLLVTDVVMPEMNGRQLAERLAEGRPGLRVLYTSGYTDDAMIARGVFERGFTFLQKPFSIEELALHVREALEAPVS